MKKINNLSLVETVMKNVLVAVFVYVIFNLKQESSSWCTDLAKNIYNVSNLI